MEKTQRKPWFSKKPIFTNVHEIILRQFFNQMGKFDRQWFRDFFLKQIVLPYLFINFTRHFPPCFLCLFGPQIREQMSGPEIL